MKIKSVISLTSQVFETMYICFVDFIFLVKNSYNIRVNTREKTFANIMLSMHSLEKGMSFPKKKSNWGKNKALDLCTLIEKAFVLYGNDERLQIAMSVLDNYIKDSYSCKEDIVVSRILNLLNEKFDRAVRAGVKQITYPRFTATVEQIVDFYKTRSSVRYFSNDPITSEELIKIEAILSSTPTACNRQTCKTYAFRGEICKKIINNQLGDQGWCNNADTVFIVTSNGSSFNSTFESKEAYIDGGMYAMNLCMALHMLKIASCFKMFVRTPKIEKEFKKICNLPQNEIPIVLLLAGHYDLTNTYMQPVSVRLNTSIEQRY